jgi:hypothetical protein
MNETVGRYIGRKKLWDGRKKKAQKKNDWAKSWKARGITVFTLGVEHR